MPELPRNERYAGFMPRFAARIVDALIMLPVLAMQYALLRYQWAVAWSLVLSFAFSLWFHVYLVSRYGGTPGKLLLDLRIAMADGTPVTARAALKRQSVMLVLMVCTSVALVVGAARVDAAAWPTLGFVARMETVVRLAPAWYGAVRTASNVWEWSELLTLLFNEQRRALHDFIGGTVVLETVTAAATASARN